MKLKEIVENNDTRLGQSFYLGVQGLIVVSIIMFCLETLPNLDEKTRYWFRVVEIVTVLIFTAEYLLRLIVADN